MSNSRSKEGIQVVTAVVECHPLSRTLSVKFEQSVNTHATLEFQPFVRCVFIIIFEEFRKHPSVPMRLETPTILCLS